jgi:hypothetical protein
MANSSWIGAMWSSWQRVLGLLSLASSAHANANPNIDVQYSAPVSSTRVLLNDGHSMPAVSLGTCCGQAGDLGVKAWLVAGGEGIDTAIGYGSEDGIAEVLRSMRPAPDRSALFITTKIHAGSGSLSDCSADPGLAVNSVHQSLKNLNVEYIDLVLLHRPCQQVAQNCLWNRPELRGCDQPFGCNCFGPAAMNESAATAANVAAPMNTHMNLLVVNGCVEFLTEQSC